MKFFQDGNEEEKREIQKDTTPASGSTLLIAG
jgi:hypothetical protein